MPSRKEVILEARTWLGVPWMHQGRSRVGVDCAGLVNETGRSLGLVDSGFIQYGREPRPEIMEALLEQHLEATDLEAESARIGDIMWMVFLRHPQHLAIRTPYGMIHAYEPMRGVVEHGFDHKWRRRVHRVYRYRGLDD